MSEKQVFDPVGRCIYCGVAESRNGSPLCDEHIVPEGMGGNLILPAASCKECADLTSFFEQNFQREMYPHIRAHETLYGKRRKKTRPTKFPVQFGKEGTNQLVPLLDYPINFFMPVFDPPGILLGRPINAELPDLRQPGRMWHGCVEDAAKRADRLSKAHNGADVTVVQKLNLPDFLKVLAKIAHSFAVAHFGYNAIRDTLLTAIIRAPKGTITEGAMHLIGCAYKDCETRIETMWQGKDAYVLAALPIDLVRPVQQRVLAVQIQLFAHAGAPVYQVILC